MDAFNIGDAVQWHDLYSPPMKVLEVEDEGIQVNITCTWFDDSDTLCEKEFPAIFLEKLTQKQIKEIRETQKIIIE